MFYSEGSLCSLSIGHSSIGDFNAPLSRIDDEHENIFAAILLAVKMLCENKAKRLCSTSSVAGQRDVEWTGHVVMHGGGPIL